MNDDFKRRSLRIFSHTKHEHDESNTEAENVNKEAKKYLSKSPLYKYWTVEIDELFVYDGQNYRLPALQLN